MILTYRTSGHLQTLYSVVGDFSKIDNVVYHRQVEAFETCTNHKVTFYAQKVSPFDGWWHIVSRLFACGKVLGSQRVLFAGD